jgi:hypothetical protein
VDARDKLGQGVHAGQAGARLRHIARASIGKRNSLLNRENSLL